MNNGFEGFAVWLIILGMKYPSADRCGLIGEEVATPWRGQNVPGCLFGALAEVVAAFFECGANGSNLLRDTECLACFGCPHGVCMDRLNGERLL